jgi:hypothetical protein
MTMRKIEPLKATSCEKSTGTEKYYYRFGTQGWAFMFLDEASGIVCLYTDWGNYSFSWHRPGRGDCTLKEFLASSSPDYLACKFHNEKEILDVEKTKAELHDLISEACDRKPKTWHEDRCKEMTDWLEDEFPSDANELFHALPDDLSELIDGNYESYFKYDRKPSFYMLRDGLLPPMLAELKKELQEPAKV